MSPNKSSAITRITRGIPKHFDAARTMVMRLPSRAIRMTKASPVRSVVGAFAIGFVVAKLARFV
jgi:hypothetical protein